MLIDNPLKFHQDILHGSQVTERKRFVTDRQTDDSSKRNMSPTPEGGDIITK